MEKNNPNIETLRRLICEAAGVSGTSPSDFLVIMGYIERRTRETIGLTTLKRVWQYGGLEAHHRHSTLDLLSRSIGYRSYDDFCQHYGDKSLSSDIVPQGGIKTSELIQGDHLLLRWNPGREVECEYLGNNVFRVISCAASKLSVGATFHGAWFAVGHPAMLANVIHGDTSWPLYEIGQQGGLTLARLMTGEQ